MSICDVGSDGSENDYMFELKQWDGIQKHATEMIEIRAMCSVLLVVGSTCDFLFTCEAHVIFVLSIGKV